MEVCMERPKLEIGLNARVFKEYYYLQEELVLFCQEYGLIEEGSRELLTGKVGHYLQSNQIRLLNDKIQIITPSSIIEEPFKFTKAHQLFFKEYVGQSFYISQTFNNWLKINGGKKYKEAIVAYQKMELNKKRMYSVR